MFSGLGILSLASGFILPFGTIIFVISALRGDHDESGQRSYSAFLSLLTLITVAVVALGIYGAFNAVINFGSSSNDQSWREIVRDVIAVIIAGAVWMNHKHNVKTMKESSGYSGSAAQRTWQATIYVMFTLVLVLGIVATFQAVYSLFALAGPGIFGNGDRGDAARHLALGLFGDAELLVIYISYRIDTPLNPAPKPAAVNPPPTPTSVI